MKKTMKHIFKKNQENKIWNKSKIGGMKILLGNCLKPMVQRAW